MSDDELEAEALHDERRKLRAELAAATAKIEDITASKEAWAKQADTLASKLTKLQTAHDQLQRDADALTARHAEVCAELDKARQNRRDSESRWFKEVESLRQQLHAVTEQRDDARNVCIGMTAEARHESEKTSKEKRELRTQLTASEALVKQQAATIEGLRMLLGGLVQAVIDSQRKPGFGPAHAYKMAQKIQQQLLQKGDERVEPVSLVKGVVGKCVAIGTRRGQPRITVETTEEEIKRAQQEYDSGFYLLQCEVRLLKGEK